MIIEVGCCAPFLRSLGFLALFPCGYEVVGPIRRIALALFAGIVILECGVPCPSHFGIAEGIGELFVGVLLAVPLVCVVGGAAVLGELLDAARGESLGSFYDPLFGHGSSLAIVARTLIWGTLVASGVLVASAELLVSSVYAVPLGSVSEFVGCGEAMLSLGSALFGETIRCAAPWIGLCLLVEGAGALVLRVIPQLTLTNDVFLAKTVGMVLLFWISDYGALGERLVSLVGEGYHSVVPVGRVSQGVFQSRYGTP